MATMADGDRCQGLRQAVETTRNEITEITNDLSDSDIPADLRQRLEALRRRLQLQLRRLEIEGEIDPDQRRFQLALGRCRHLPGEQRPVDRLFHLALELAGVLGQHTAVPHRGVLAIDARRQRQDET